MKFKSSYLPFIIISVFGALIFFIGIYNHYLFKTATYDYGNYNFAFWDYSHFRISPLPTFRGNFLQDHFSLTLMYFIPIYWLLNWLTHTYTLIIIQCSLILISAWYSHKIIKLKTENLWLSNGVLLFYFLLLGRYTTFGADVNLAIISACFIPIFLYYFEVKKYFIATIIFILSLLSRENIPLWFIFVFIVLIIQHRKDKVAVWYSLGGIIASIIYFVLLFKVIIPSLEAPDTKYALFNYSALGNTPGEALSFILKHPFESIKLCFVNHLNDSQFDGVKVEFYWVCLLSGGIILFLRPQYLIWFIPIIAQKVLNDSPIRWGISSYYSVEVITILPVSVYLVLASLTQKNLVKILSVVVCVGAFSVLIHKMDTQNCKVPWMMNPKKEKFYDKRFYERPFDIKKVNHLLSLIPSDAKVSASNMLVPHIAQRQHIYFFPTVKDAEYIAFSVLDNYFLISQKDNEQSRLRYLSDPNWELVALEYPVFLLKKRSITGSNQTTLDKIAGKDAEIFCNYDTIDSVNQLAIFSNGNLGDHIERISSEISFSGENSMNLKSKDSFGSSINIENTDSLFFLKAEVWCKSEGDHGFIVASGTNNFYRASFESDSISSNGWKRLVLNFWIPTQLDEKKISIALGSNSNEPVYFDDFKITKIYRKIEN